MLFKTFFLLYVCVLTFKFGYVTLRLSHATTSLDNYIDLNPLLFTLIIAISVYLNFNLIFNLNIPFQNLGDKVREKLIMASYANNYVFLLLCLGLSFCTIAFGGNFNTDFNILFGDFRANIQNGGNVASLQMDKNSGSGIGSKNAYLYGRFDMQIKLVPGNSAGIVTAFYVRTLFHNPRICMQKFKNIYNGFKLWFTI